MLRRRPDRNEARLRPSPGGGWTLAGVQVQASHDDDLGTLLFPAYDRVMAPWIAEYHTWEPLERAWIERTLRPGDTFLNVGANVGYHALLASRLVGPEGRVIAVEPDPVVSAFLVANLATHDARNVEVHRCAAGSARATLTLHLGADNSGDNRLTPFDASSGGVKVPVRRMDELLTGRRISAVLTDTQGWDHEVIAGMTGLLADQRPPMVVEFVPRWLRERGIDPERVVCDLQGYGYRVGVLEAGLAPGAPAVEVVQASDNDERWCSNLLLQPL